MKSDRGHKDPGNNPIDVMEFLKMCKFLHGFFFYSDEEKFYSVFFSPAFVIPAGIRANEDAIASGR